MQQEYSIAAALSERGHSQNSKTKTAHQISIIAPGGAFRHLLQPNPYVRAAVIANNVSMCAGTRKALLWTE